MRFSRKSIPTVDINLLLNVPSVYRYKKVVLPTPESPAVKKNKYTLSECWVISFLMAHQHSIGYIVPYN